jgi:hypothetical protein
VLALCCSIALLVGILSLIFVFPALSRQSLLEKSISRRATDLEEMKALKIEWDILRKTRAQAEGMLERRGQQFALLSFLEAVSKEMGIEKKIQHMKPVPLSEEPVLLRAEAVEISLNDLTSEELVRLLFQIECSEKLLSVKRTTVQRAGNPGAGLLKVALQVHTYTSVAAPLHQN